MTLELVPWETTVSIGAARDGVDLGRPELSIANGSVRVVRDGDQIGVRALSFEFEDVQVSRDHLPPAGQTLTQIVVTMSDSTTATTAWFGGKDEAYFEATATMQLDWAIATDDGTLPLMSQELSPVHLIGHAFIDEKDNPTIAIDASVDGVFFQWADLELFDARLGARAVAASPDSPL
jgi:hypothetical protein